MDWVLIVGVALVVLFDLSNGLHDASNMVATMVASRALAPLPAVLLVGVFGFLGPLLGGTAVADTMGGLVEAGAPGVSLVIVAALVGAIGWNLITWRWGLPSSSSHALIGALTGAAVVVIGPAEVHWGSNGLVKVILSLFVSPLLGFAVGFALQRLLRRALASARPSINRQLKRIQILTASALAFAHGTNDGQKGMGLIALLLWVRGVHEGLQVPLWSMVVCASALLLGTLLGGWRIVRTLGYGIYRLRPLHGMNVQLAAAAVVIGAGALGGPVSTTHVVSSSIMGVGASERPRAVRWGKAWEIAWTWVTTLPAAAILGGIVAFVLEAAHAID